jgi:hypothetical protein
MPPSIQIHYPSAKAGDPQHPDRKEESQVSTSFVAFGVADKPRDVVGTLTGNTSRRQYRGTTLVQPPNWVILFQRIPPSAGVDGETYTLTVHYRRATHARHEFGPISVVNRCDLFRIDYPPPQWKVCPVFAAYGASDTSPVVGSLQRIIDAKPAYYFGKVIQQPFPANVWVIQFGSEKLEAGPWDFVVTGQGEKKTTKMVTVDAASCPKS